MKNSIILALCLLLLGIIFAYMAVVVEQQQVYYKHFMYSTDDYEDEYEGMFTISITGDNLIIADTADHPMVFKWISDDLYSREGYPQVYELIRNDYSVVLQQISTDDTNSLETLYFTGITRY
jgi:hypothetical protein